MAKPITQSILNDLTYGSQISRPDPAIQPIVRLANDQYVISPGLITSCSPERNFTVLLNQLPPQRSIYSRLVEQKEALMRDSMCESIASLHLRSFSGSIPGRKDLPDIDLAIISDIEKACIIAELKWFIAPAEAREIIQRSEEIQKGIAQMLRLSRAADVDHGMISDLLGIDSEYELVFVVISANSIGHGTVQDIRIPVINQDHLVKKLCSGTSFRGVVSWLRSRDYLPREGADYRVVPIVRRVGRWALEWYGIKPLLVDDFA
jgi:hypothetical protein